MKIESIEELNRLGKAWFEAKPEDKAPLAESIFLLANQLFEGPAIELKTLYGNNPPPYSEALTVFYETDWSGFDPNQEALYSYMKKRLVLRLIDMLHQDRADRRLQNKECHEKREWVSNLSFDASISGDGETTGYDQYAAEDTADALIYNDTAVEFITLALSFSERLTGRAKNPTRINYFRMFFTDSVVDILHKAIDSLPFERHERELFENAIKTAFLDFFMRKVCRRVSEIEVCPLKFWGEMVEGRGMDIIPEHPLPIDVYLAYLNKKEGKTLRADSVISNHRKEYEQWLRENLLC